METLRRHFLQMSGASAITSIMSRKAFALDYPSRPVRIINSTAAGGSLDIVARLIGEFLQVRLGQPFIVDDRPGGGGNIAANAVLRAPADGYTLRVVSKGALLANLFDDHLDFDFFRDFSPVATVAAAPLVMLTHPSVPAVTLRDFITYAQDHPGKLNFVSLGTGSDPQLAGELFKMKAGVELTPVPYRGGSLAMTDLLAGNVHVMFSNLPSDDYVKAGKLRGLGVTTRERSATYPELPAIAEFLPDYVADVWFGFVARSGTPSEITEKLGNEMRAAAGNTKVRDGLAVLNEVAPVSETGG